MMKIEPDPQIFKTYYQSIKEIHSTGDNTEYSFRTPFETFINSLCEGINVLQEQRRAAGLGAPDFKAFRGAVNVGYIETKDIGAPLDEVLESEQIRKYVNSIDNLILTNYCRFILLRKGQTVLDFNLFNVSDLSSSHHTFPKEKIVSFKEMAETFFGYQFERIDSGEELARELSKKAKLLKEIAVEQLKDDEKKVAAGETPSPTYYFYKGITELITDLSISDCADAYAQTITYGLFLAKKKSAGPLTKETSAGLIPRNIGVIKEIFTSISTDTLQSNITWIIEDIIDILNASDLQKILSTIASQGKKYKDPFTYFYEDFLQLYDPKKREKAGVYYTPRPVVNFIVNVIHQSLKDDFERMRGFAEENVNVLDPAIGTGTFLWITYLRVFNELLENKLNALIRPTIKNHVLKDFYGFELLITPYIVAHLKLASLLEQWHYNLSEQERIPVYLTNTLEHSVALHGLLPFMREISEESRIADRIKSKPILVILGNPPYSGMSSNKGKWIDDLLKKGYKRADGSKDLGYYTVDGKPLGEKNPKWLQDDYVKFIRFAQWKIDTAGEGILGYITNHSYLDNPTFRGMRQSLMQSFERIYILNLHGNSLKKEKCPDGSKDENVFDIQQGTAIAIFIKNKKYTDHKVYYADLYGDRKFKYDWLDKLAQDAPNWRKTINWQELSVKTPYYYFVPRDYSLEDEYMKYWKITDIFPVNSVGIVTARDDLTIKNTPEEVWTTVTNFISMKPEEARQRFNLGEDARDWKVELAQKDIRDSGPDKKNVVPILHKPFDTRYTYYTGNSRGFHCMPRDEVMKNMVRGGNLAIITTRQTKDDWAALITDTIITHKSLSAYDIDSLFPLYLPDGQGERKPNLDPKFFEKLKKKYSEKISPEDVLYYIYAIFHSVKYKDRYADALKSDFPRIPFVADHESFKRLSALGKELADLHLLKKQLPTTTRFQVAGTNKVEGVKYVDGKVYINKDQFFEGIPPEVWEFHIGGYQVLDKWLKERKGRDISGELEHFLQVVEALRETIRIMKEIDSVGFLP